MKKQVYLTIIGIGALLAIIGFSVKGFGAIWGILIAVGAGAIYYFNTKNEQKVQERLEDEQNAFGQGDSTEEPAAEDNPADSSDSDD